ncbi:MAG: Phenylalanine--tRNA ligase beta subunit, partial [Chlamydiae bacterium]|nr:Phenylalanine--tRNA ligase beta subunit [Chlamydiota bacterium]
MHIPLNWLKEYLQTEQTPEKLDELLTNIGLEVEAMHATDQGLVIEIALTPNLAHCASVIGVARELAAVTEETVTLPQFSVKEEAELEIETFASVAVDAPEFCPRYSCRVITGVEVGASPPWLSSRLEACGLRSINNIVDITNYVLMEYGHPLHAFDYDLLEERKIVVRMAKKGEKIVTLDGKEHFPTPDSLLICDAKKPVAIAGVMGSFDSEVNEGATTILLESAYFEPTQVRRTSKRMGIMTEASRRFERGTDPNIVLTALDRATALIQEHAQGKVVSGIIDVRKQEFPPKTVSCRLARINQILGTQLGLGEVETMFSRLGLKVLNTKEDVLEVSIPTFRCDIHQEIDLIEEIARLYGYNNLHSDKAISYHSSTLPHNPVFLFERRARSLLLREGLQELFTCDLISPAQAALVAPDCMPSRSLIKLLNPGSMDHSVLRPSLLPSLLAVVKYNGDREMPNLAGFEIGRTHFQTKKQTVEPTVISLVLTGKRTPHHFSRNDANVDFFDLKGILENFFSALKIDSVSFCSSNYTNFHPGRQARILIGDHEIGIMGQIHPTTLSQADLSQQVFFAELNLDDVREAADKEMKMTPLPLYPSSVRDWTITLKNSAPVDKVLQLVEEERPSLLEEVSLLDLY